MQHNRQPRPARRRLSPLYVSLVVACCLAAGCWLAGNGRPVSRGPIAGLSPTATAAPAMPTAGPSLTPQPVPSLAPAAPPAASGPPTRIVAPAIHLDAPVVAIGFTTAYLGDVPVTSWQLPANAAGFHIGSAYPGNAGNCVLSGHNNIQGEVFRYVADLEPGDEVFLYVGDTAYRYVVASKEIVPERDMPAEVRIANAQAIAPGGEERLTLVTCWPYTGNTHRVIVVARPAPLEPLTPEPFE